MEDPLGRNSTADPAATLAAIASIRDIVVRMTHDARPGNQISALPATTGWHRRYVFTDR
jgi:hypothetical protein